MVIDTALNWSSSWLICDTTTASISWGHLPQSLLPQGSVMEFARFLHWQSWLNNDIANNVIKTPLNQASLVGDDLSQSAMITLFPIILLVFLWLSTLYNLYKTKEKVKKASCVIGEVSHKLDQQSRFLRTQEQLLERLRGQNSSLRKQQSALFEVISHELKNPLTAIKTNFVAWFRLASYDEVTLDRARMVENSIARLEAFCEQAGSMHELEDQSKVRGTANLSQLLRNICHHYTQELNDRGIAIDLQAECDYIVPGQSRQLSGMVSNLINYAVKRATSGSKFTLSLTHTQKHLVLKLTEPGFRPSTHTGTFIESAEQIEIQHGPELFFASRIAQYLNLVIHTRSDVKVGTVTNIHFPEFEISQPETAITDDDAPMLYFDHQQHPVLELCGPSTSSPRCLVLDDDPQLQSCLGRILSKHFNVKGVFDAQTAVAETRQWQPNLIICEVRLGGLHAGNDGDMFRTIEKMKRCSETNDIPVIVLTTQDSIENRLKALELDVFSFFAKPFSEELLSKTALRICSNTAAKKELENIKDNIPFQQSRDTIFLNQLNALIERNLDNTDFHFEDYFEQFSLSKRQFFRRVNALTRCTPKQYLINKRLELAKHLLSKGVLLEKVTKSCGFRDAKTLTKLYQAHYGEEII